MSAVAIILRAAVTKHEKESHVTPSQGSTVFTATEASSAARSFPFQRLPCEHAGMAARRTKLTLRVIGSVRFSIGLPQTSV